SSIARRQWSRRSRPAAVSDQGREPSTFGAHSRYVHSPALLEIASAHSAITTATSVLRTPPQLVFGSCSVTPRPWKALVRATSLRALVRGPDPLRLRPRAVGAAFSASPHSAASW